MHTLNFLAMAGMAAAFTGVRVTYYDGLDNGNLEIGACGLPSGSLPASVIYGTALSVVNWDNKAHCGSCINVHYGGKTIKAMVSFPLLILIITPADCSASDCRPMPRLP